MKLYLHQFSVRFALAALLLAQLSFTPCGKARPDTWIKLADRTVTHTVDHSELTIEGVHENLNAIRLKVVRGAINLHRCVVYYKDSQTQDFTILNSIPAGGESKVIELPRAGQPVTKLVFVYDTKNRGIQKADVEIWGRQ